MDLQPLANLCASAAVGPDSARLWFRVAEQCAYEVRLETLAGEVVARCPLDVGHRFGDGVVVIAYPRDVPGACPLSPLTTYRYTLRREGEHVPVLEGEFETAPPRGEPAPEPFSIAVISCHQPFGDDGEVDPRSTRMLSVLPEVLRRERVKRVLMVGDQMYTDVPQTYSLFDAGFFRRVAPPGRSSIFECTDAEVRDLLCTRYRRAWGVAQFSDVQRGFPCYLMPDDHEFVDNWGADPEHSAPKWQAFGKGALAACHDYELSRLFDSSEPPFHFELEYGDIACFVMDLRSQKRTLEDVTIMYGPEQLRAFEAFLERHADASVVMLAFSVPLVYLPDWLGRLGERLMPEGGDLHDRWSVPRAHEARDAIVQRLKAHRRAHPEQLQILLGGDVHVSAAVSVHWGDVPGPIYQLTASPLSNNSGHIKANLAKLLCRLKPHLERESAGGVGDADLLPGTAGHASNPLAKLNVGILSFEPRGPEMHVTMKLYTYDRLRPERPKLAYCSEPLRVPRRARQAS